MIPTGAKITGDFEGSSPIPKPIIDRHSSDAFSLEPYSFFISSFVMALSIFIDSMVIESSDMFLSSMT